MVDIHCHILPDTDDGPASWDTSLEMCRVAAADGIRHIVATPHANDDYSYDRARHSATLDRLRHVSGGALTFSLGCDFHLSYDNVQDALAHPNRYVLASSPYLLIEFSDFGIAPALLQALQKLRDAGLRPVVTHPERNMVLQRNPAAVLRLAEEGCVVQVTGSSLTGFWGDAARDAAHWLMERDAVHVLASDAHNASRRPPVLSAAQEAAAHLVGGDVARALVKDNPAAIVAGQALPYFPKPVLRG